MTIFDLLKTVCVAGAILVPLLPAQALATNQTCEIEPQVGAPRVERAVSLRGLIAEAQQCQQRGRCPPEVRYLYSLTRVEGFVEDPANSDIILFGAVEPGAPPLHLEDFVVALRNTAGLYVTRRESDGALFYSDPAVSIDASPEVSLELRRILDAVVGGAPTAARDRALEAFCETCTLAQDVSVYGVPATSRFAQTLVTADYHLKRIVNGEAQLQLPGLQSLAEMQLARVKELILSGRAGTISIGGLTRFWFYPGHHVYRAGDGAVLLARSDVVLLDEQQRLTRDGAREDAGYRNELVERFTCDFSRRYREIADSVRVDGRLVYREMEDIFRWVSLTRIMKERQSFHQARFDPGFLLHRFVVPKIPAAETLPGLARVGAWDHVEERGSYRREISLRLPSCGGVSIRFGGENLIKQDDAPGRLAHIAGPVLESRPFGRPTAWWIRQAR